MLPRAAHSKDRVVGAISWGALEGKILAMLRVLL